MSSERPHGARDAPARRRTPEPIGAKARLALGWDDLLVHLALLCHTERGKEQARSLPFLESVAEVERELSLVTEARSLHEQGEPMPLGGISDLGPALRRLEKEGVLDPPALIQVAETLEGGSRLHRFLVSRIERTPGLARRARQIACLDEISGAVRDALDEKGGLADHASPELARLRQRVLELHEQVTRRMRGLLEEPLISKYLQDSFYTQREDRYVLPVRTDAGSAVEGIVHGQSASGATIFVEPQQVVGLNNQLKVAQMAVVREELRILRELSDLVREEILSVSKNLDELTCLDVINARARLSVALAAGPVGVVPAGESLELRAMRHPLMVLAGTEVVPNDLELRAGQGLIITGPNAGGKTVCLKTLGLCALMVRAGLHPPVDPESKVPLFGQVLTDMGDDQSIEQSLSTFTAHLGNLLDFLEASRPGSLILLDEVGIGTDPREGAALAQAILERFVQSQAHLAVTTHFEKLKGLPLADPRFVNASVGFDLAQMQPTYRLHPGLPGSSVALDVARRLGLSPELAQRAAELLRGEAQDLASLLSSLAGERTKLEEERAALARESEALARREAKLTEELAKLREKERKALHEATNAALEELKRARQDLERVRALLRRPVDRGDLPQRVRQADRQISSAASKIRENEPRREMGGRPARTDELVPGQQVIVAQLGGIGEVTAPPRRGKVDVQVGGIRTSVPLDTVLLAPQSQLQGQALQERPATASLEQQTRRNGHLAGSPGTPPRDTPALLRTQQNTLDVRGLRVDEALAEVERFLDRALQIGEPGLFIIHGHGTGALRSAIREHLSTQVLVGRHHPADLPDGGDGVTVVWLR